MQPVRNFPWKLRFDATYGRSETVGNDPAIQSRADRRELRRIRKVIGTSDFGLGNGPDCRGRLRLLYLD